MERSTIRQRTHAACESASERASRTRAETSHPRSKRGRALARAAAAVAAVAGLALTAGAAGTGCGVEYPNCRNDQDCRRDNRREVCVNQRCQQCRATSDCAEGQTCLRNRCVPGLNACEGDNDCLATQRCVENRCVPRSECDDSRPCPGGRPCEQGRCATATTEPPDPVDNAGRLCQFQPVMFGFDEFALDEAARRALQTAAECLGRERNTRYVMIGRADPRGTTEYNFALGERRASAVQRYLVSLGVDQARLAVSSEGSEAASGTDEASWARDRRVDFRPRD